MRGRWLSLREALGDRRRVSIRYGGRRLTLRLGTSDILVLYSVFEREDYGIELSSHPMTIVDAGAYTGLSTIYFAEKYPAAKILALEPDPSNFALLVQNTRPYPNIIPLHQALWHGDGRIDLQDPGTGHWGFYVAPDEPRPEWLRAHVEAVSVRTLLERFALERIDLLKMNIEGAEKEILESSGDWIGSVGAIFAALHDRFLPGCTEAFENATASFDRIVHREGMTCAIRDVSVLPASNR
ncbi:MAG TPA: FkbM family methyltransferase [Thermoanaerobaculia bacterium]